MTCSESPSNERLDDLLGQVVDEYLQRLANGEDPAIEGYADQYPEIATSIRQTFPALQMVRHSFSESDQSNDIDLARNKRLGDFQLLRKLGSGGMGCVYEAKQLSMGRNVALKVLPFAGMIRGNALQRFHNEVRAAAALDHPNIVSVYSVGEERGVHFYAMQLIRGQSLAQVIAQLATFQRGGNELTGDTISEVVSHRERGAESEKSTPTGVQSAGSPDASYQPIPREKEDGLSPSFQATGPDRKFYRSIAILAAQAAEALEHAHQNGVVHRDIKPGNLMLDADSQLYVTDFGLARIDNDTAMTMTGDLIGTLRYMSPEQALAKRVVVDHRCDVYSLGMTLYELFVLKPAYHASDRQELLKQIAFEEPTKPRKLNRSIPPELETIVLKSIEKNPNDRYSSAQAMADDLNAFIDHRPIQAKPASHFDRFSKWTRRHHDLVLGALVMLAIALCISVFGGMLILRSQQELRQQRQEVLDAYQLSSKLRASQLNSTGDLLSPRRMAFLDDKFVYVTSTNTNSVLLFESQTGELLKTVIASESGELRQPIGLAISPANELFVASAANNRVLRYDAQSGERIGELNMDRIAISRPSDLFFHRDGDLYLTSDQGQILVFTPDGEFKHVFMDGIRSPRSPLFSDTECFLVASYYDHYICKFDQKSGTRIDRFIGPTHSLMRHPCALAIGPDGYLYVGCDSTNCVLRFDAETGHFIDVFIPPRLEGLYGIGDLEFRDNGYLYICSRHSNEILRFDAASGKFVDEFVTEKSRTSTAAELFLLSITLAQLGEEEQARLQFERASAKVPVEMNGNQIVEHLRSKAWALLASHKNR